MSNLISAFKRVFRAINIFAAIFATKGSYLIVATQNNDTTIFIENTSDFSSTGGNGHIIDTINDRDAFTYTGKTSKTLIGCTGVLVHNNGATCIPLVKAMVIDNNVNEMRFFGDRGDGTIEELANVGITTVDSIGTFGTINSSRRGAYCVSDTGEGIYGDSLRGFGGVFATTSSGKAPLLIAPLAGGNPTHDPGAGGIGGLWMTSGPNKLFINHGGSVWRPVGGYSSLVWDKLITGAAVSSVTTDGEVSLDGNSHGGYEFEFSIINSSAGTARYRAYYNNDIVNTNYNIHSIYSTGGTAVSTFGNEAYFETSGVGLGVLIVFVGSITIDPSGYVASQSINHHHGSTVIETYVHKKIAVVANLTRIDIIGSVDSSIGINSRFRLWRRI